jgi:hypothetical protein
MYYNIRSKALFSFANSFVGKYLSVQLNDNNCVDYIGLYEILRESYNSTARKKIHHASISLLEAGCTKISNAREKDETLLWDQNTNKTRKHASHEWSLARALLGASKKFCAVERLADIWLASSLSLKE